MTLIVEDGTGLATAESYLSVADATTYITNYVLSSGTWLTTATTAEKEKALRIASKYIDIQYHSRWKGYRTNDAQALDWPRYEVYDADDYLIASDELPQRLLQATAEMAIRALTSDILTDITSSGSVSAYRVKVGPIEESTEYSGGGNSPETYYRKVDRMLKDFIIGQFGVERA